MLSRGIRSGLHLVFAVHQSNSVFDLGDATLESIRVLLLVQVKPLSILSDHLQSLAVSLVSSGWNPVSRGFHTPHSVQIRLNGLEV